MGQRKNRKEKKSKEIIEEIINGILQKRNKRVQRE
jgi:hypothetical protein